MKKKVVRLTESDLRRIVKKVLTEGEVDCIEHLNKLGYSDVTSDFTKPDGVIFLPDGDYDNMDDHNSDYAVVMGKDGNPTGYAVCVVGVDSSSGEDYSIEGWRSNPVKKIKIRGNGGQIGTIPKGFKITNIFLNDKLLSKSGLSTST